MRFTETMWAATDALQQSILTMPFNRELATGALAPETFQHYIIQDAHYLEGFARALALAATRAPDADAIMQLSGAANDAIAVERQLHGHYMALYRVDALSFAATEPTPVCDHYVSYLLRTAAIADLPEVLAALLPCFWVYLRVGQDIHANATSNNPYRAWIDTYAGEDFAKGVEQMLELTDRVAGTASDVSRVRMHQAFRHSTRLEWMFWDSAYHRRQWLVPDTAP
ncbi:thiaminase II [Hyphomonas sp.]|uniref:thiaminase II n=1 Tax=Hyphomonas sp. TaxID=87 RepID=UPI0039E5665E